MTLDQITRVGLNPAFKLLPELMDSPRARVVMLAIGLQESRFENRYQLLNNTSAKGPARGFWQFERGGGCKGVVSHELSKPHMRKVCEARGIPFTATALWNAIETDDVAAAAAARLLLWTDPQRLPELGDDTAAYALYLRTWRPGKPKPDTWSPLYRQALAFIQKA
jgi:hypothetical protein